jgi:FHS family L-fucose permease-like MFS transporter
MEMIKNRPFFRRYKTTFIILGIAFIVVAIFMNFSKIENQQKIEKQLLLR